MLTPAQLTTLKADILADPILAAQPNTSDGAFAIAQAYNLAAIPVFWVWRTSVSKAEFTQQTSQDGTSFTWVGNGFITRSVGEQTAWRELFNATESVNPSLANVRQAFLDIFSGAGNAALNRAHMTIVARRKATRAETLFAVGTGSTVSPGTMTFEGALSFQDVQDARNLP